jgi:hypothetical protein
LHDTRRRVLHRSARRCDSRIDAQDQDRRPLGHASDRFALAGIHLVRAKRSLAAATKLQPGKLRPGIHVRITRTSTSVTATISNLRGGHLHFAVAPSRLGAATTAETAVVSASNP